MAFFEKEFTFDRVVRIIITLAIIVGIIFLLDYFSSVLIPFVIAVIIAYLMSPFVNFIQKFVKKRILAVIISLLLITGFFVGIGFIVFPMIGNEVSHASKLIEHLFSNKDWQAEIYKYLPDKWDQRVEKFLASGDIQQLLNEKQINELIDFSVRKVIPGIGSIVGYTIEIIIGVFGLLIIFLYLFFILLDFNDLVSQWKSLIPPKLKNTVLGVVYDFEKAMNKYFRAQSLIAAIVGVLFAIGFTIIGLPMGIVLGLFVGVLNLVPYLQNIALLPAVFLSMLKSLETGQNFWIVLGLVLLVFIVVQAIQDGILTPKIMGDATGLNPAVILLSLTLWGKMLGMLGLLIALPMTYLLLSYYQRIISKSHKMEGPLQQKSDIDLIGENLRKMPDE